MDSRLDQLTREVETTVARTQCGQLVHRENIDSELYKRWRYWSCCVLDASEMFQENTLAQMNQELIKVDQEIIRQSEEHLQIHNICQKYEQINIDIGRMRADAKLQDGSIEKLARGNRQLSHRIKNSEQKASRIHSYIRERLVDNLFEQVHRELQIHSRHMSNIVHSREFQQSEVWSSFQGEFDTYSEDLVQSIKAAEKAIIEKKQDIFNEKKNKLDRVPCVGPVKGYVIKEKLVCTPYKPKRCMEVWQTFSGTKFSHQYFRENITIAVPRLILWE